MSAGDDRSLDIRMVVTVLFGGLTFVIGGVLGALSLMSQPVREIAAQTASEELEPGIVYYRKGSDVSGRWRMKRNQLVRRDTPTVRFSENDLNDWSRHHFREIAERESAPEDGAEAEAANDGGGTIFGLERKASPPNFAIVDGRLQISSFLEVPAALGTRRFLYQVVGDFGHDADGMVVFVPASGTIGQAPLVNLPILGRLLHSHIAAYFEEFAEWSEMQAHWPAVTSAAIEGDELVLSVNAEQHP